MPKPKVKERPSLERKIYFFRSSVGQDAAGASIPFDPTHSLTTLHKLPFSDTKGRYLVDADGNALSAWVDHLGPNPRMRFAQIRRVGLPQIDAAGNLTELNLEASEGLVEAVHVVFFPNALVGVEFNFYGPRPSRLGYYLMKNAGVHPMPAFNPLLRSDVSAQLDRLDDIRLFDLKINASYASVLKQADADLGAAFDAARKLGEPEEIGIVLRAGKPTARSLLNRLKNSTRTLLSRPDLRTESSHFVVRGQMNDSGRVEALDLLRDQLISNKRIVKLSERGRALDTNAAYDAITEAHNELAGELANAAALVS